MEELINIIIAQSPQVLLYGSYVVGGSIALRALAEVLNYVSEKTDNTVDNKIAYYVSEAAWMAAKLAAIFGARTTLKVPEKFKD